MYILENLGKMQKKKNMGFYSESILHVFFDDYPFLTVYIDHFPLSLNTFQENNKYGETAHMKLSQSTICLPIHNRWKLK